MEQRFSNTGGDHREPFGWWGHRADPDDPLSIADLIAGGTLDARVAAFLWLALERRVSLAVAARPHDAGKTTTLTALLDFLPADVEPIYLRGWYERFEFLETTTPDRAYLLCNEISSHLPTYLWGRGVRRMFEAMGRGYGMATTVHAGGAREVLDVLTAYPLEVPPELSARIDLVLTLGVGAGTAGRLRRLMRLEMIHERGGAVEIETLAERDVLLGPLVSRPGRLIGLLGERFGLDPAEVTTQLARREQFLERLARDGHRSATDVRAALRRFTAEQGPGSYTPDASPAAP